MSTTQYTLTVNLADATIQALQQGQYTLYGFAAYNAPPAAGAVVWFQTTDFGEAVQLTWSDSYAVYTAHGEPVAGGQITGTNPYPLPTLGETLLVTSPAGLGTLSNAGTPGAVTVINQTSTPFTCGLSLTAPAQTGATKPGPVCAVPLFGNNEVVMTPGSAVFLMFATAHPIPAGTVLETSVGPGVLIPFPSGTTTQTLAYDINKGWSGGGTSYPPNTSLSLLNTGMPTR